MLSIPLRPSSPLWIPSAPALAFAVARAQAPAGSSSPSPGPSFAPGPGPGRHVILTHVRHAHAWRNVETTRVRQVFCCQTSAFCSPLHRRFGFPSTMSRASTLNVFLQGYVLFEKALKMLAIYEANLSRSPESCGCGFDCGEQSDGFLSPPKSCFTGARSSTDHLVPDSSSFFEGVFRREGDGHGRIWPPRTWPWILKLVPLCLHSTPTQWQPDCTDTVTFSFTRFTRQPQGQFTTLASHVPPPRPQLRQLHVSDNP